MKRTKEITLIPILVATCFAVKYIFIALPTVRPITAIIILTSVFLSIKIGAIVGTLTMLISGMLMGFGIWVPLQVIAYIIIALGVAFLPKKNIVIVSIYGFVVPFIYGLITNISMLPYIEHSTFITLWISGIWFDFLHAVSTLAFILVLYKPFQYISERF